MNVISEKWKRGIAVLLSVIIMLSTVLTDFPVIDAWGESEYYPGLTMLSGGEDWRFFCIDSYELLHEAGGVQGTNEWYAYVIPSTRLSGEETAILFWAALTLRAGKGDSPECKSALDKINASAPAFGLPIIRNTVSEADMKTILHLPSTRDRYPWMNTVLAQEEKYLEMAGLLGSPADTSAGGKPIPAILQNHTEVSSALAINSNPFILEFAPSGADKDFIHKIPLKFSTEGGVFEALPIGGWTYQKTDTSIIFSNPNPQPPKLLIQFDTTGTEYQVGKGYASVQEAYDKALQLWVCIECNDRHIYHSQKKLPLEAHQRLVYLETDPVNQQYYASIAGSPVAGPAESGTIQFQIYRHEEDMESTYNLQLSKYDHETGNPLENSVFKLYERFDSQDEIDRYKDGPVHIYEGGKPYKSYHTDNPVTWDGFRFVSGVSTDENGRASKMVNHGYHYDKTFCDGHPAPAFVPVPEEEEEEEEETGEAAISNEEEIEAAQSENKRLARSWLSCYADCKAHAAGDFEGVHFHYLMPEVSMGEIESILDSGGSPGESPNAGRTTSASAEESYQESGCLEDCQKTYDKFISLRYSYAFVESKARDGYVLHDIHTDSLPIEVITTDSSENGANAHFADAYSKDITINDAVMDFLADETLRDRERTAANHLSSEKFGIPEDIRLSKGKSSYVQGIIHHLTSGKATASNAEAERCEDTELIDDLSGTATTPDGSAPSEATPLEAAPSKAAPSKAAPSKAAPSKAASSQATPSQATPSQATLSKADPLKVAPTNATPTNATPSNARPSDSDVATPSNISYYPNVVFSKSYESPVKYALQDNEEDTSGSQSASLFQNSYQTALHDISSGSDVEAGPNGNYSHCSGQDGEGDAWRIYDHRTEGEIHINKRDMELEDGEAAGYDSYGDSQGDGTLEGAVYGLFAAADIIHPDGKTGAVYKANNLVAVASADRNGDASFLVSTEPPGFRYHYESGSITRTEDGWAEEAPQNLYVSSISHEDYSGDDAYRRTYTDHEENNGNCWIGRPLILGSYYIKELTRSEGYELSIGNRDSALTNRGQDCNAALPVGTGYANISRGLYAEGQISSDPTGDFGNPDINELFFTAESKGTAQNGFDIVLSNIPAGSRFFRLDTGKVIKEVQKGTGIYEKVYLTNEDGTPKYAEVENNYQYPKYNPDGSLMTRESSINYRADQIPAKAEKPLDAEKTRKSITAPEPEMTQEQVAAKLAASFAVEDKIFLKAKTERALRENGKRTPYSVIGGKTTYSSVSTGVYNTGVRKGDADENGISGVSPGEPASDTVYGTPLVTLEIPALKENGSPLDTGGFILTILDYYNSNSFYSFGGIHEISQDDLDSENGGRYYVTVYASCHGDPADFIVRGSGLAGDGILYHRIPYMPDDEKESPRYIYADYSDSPGCDTFGTYEDYSGETIGGTYFASATLITDAEAKGDGTLVSKTVKQNVYYQTGEIPHDETGKRIKAFEYREQMIPATQEVEAYTWAELTTTLAGSRKAGDGTAVHIDSSYTDSYGQEHNDSKLQTYSLRIVLPRKEITLTQNDLETMQPTANWIPGEKMGSAAYYLTVRHAKANAYLNYSDLSIIGDSSFVKRADLFYPGQDHVWQDGAGRPGTNTRIVPVAVQERAIKQKIKITKTIDHNSYNEVNTYSNVHKDWFTRLYGMIGKEAQSIGNFRFKIYLKSNLERLYRDEDGRIVWMERNGNPVDLAAYRSEYPGKVQKIYTKVPHSQDVRKNSKEAATANQELYSFSDGLINDTHNPGYASILEATGRKAQNDGQLPRVLVPNYQKLFDGIRTANTDRWDNPLCRDREFTGWSAWDAVRNAWEGEIDPAVWDTSYKPFASLFSDVISTSGHTKNSPPSIHNSTVIRNEKNTSAEARKNAMSSDAVRQFAITWYLEDEVKKLVHDDSGFTRYPDEIYDTALTEAIKKANHYLTPFFLYDLDGIYSIEWDSQPNGGKDNDSTTLSADFDDGADGYYYGVSAYLPYGTYVAVEQQPYDHKEGRYDFANRHYKTDAPKEIVLPAVYEQKGEKDAETLAERYKYQSTIAPEKMAADYQIRFNEEWAKNHTDDIRGYVIRAHNANGDFEVYKYGLDIGRLTGTAGGSPYAGWKVTQDTYDPLKDYYNDPLVDTKEEGGHPDSHYFADDQNSSPDLSAYPSDEIEKYYHYASISEHAAIRDSVQFPCGQSCDGLCVYGGHFRDHVLAMEGELMAYEGLYAQVLVPYTVSEPAEGGAYAGSSFQNTFYSTGLRIEKLDSETGESILHDQAVFAIYAAERDDSETGEGRVKFYEKPTVISGTREFLEAMGASDMNTRAREIPHPDLAKDALWYGTVPKGTPVCKESEQILLRDTDGDKTGEFHAFSTMRDGNMKPEPEDTVQSPSKPLPSGKRTAADQNTGYLKLPQPLGAGVYVLAEIKPPAGYARSKPIAVEIYSDRVTYYLDGNRDKRVAAAIYEETSNNTGDLAAATGFHRTQSFLYGHQPSGSQARIYVGNAPVRLEVSKKKTDGQTTTYRVSGRVEGSITELNGRYGLENLELAYNSSGTYLGYGWRKGTIESLAARKTAGETVEIFYENGVFSGYADLTRPLLTADDPNRYVAGAVLTLYDAIPVRRNGDSQDYAFDGIKVERDRNGNVTRMYVQQGYAGTKIDMVQLENHAPDFTASEKNGSRNGIWTYRNIRRPDTDILYYDLGNLKVMSKDNAGNLWSYGKEGKPMRIINGVTKSIYALSNNRPAFEIASGDFTSLQYDPMAKAFTKISPDTVIYHLDADGQRDSMVDSYTGMAYVERQKTGLRTGENQDQQGIVMVWPVTVIKDRGGSILAKHKIKTSRIASIHADTNQEYITGTFSSDGNGNFEKRLSPVFGTQGQVEYYQRSEEIYRKSVPVYDRDGDFIYDRCSDHLRQYNHDAYTVKAEDIIFDIGLPWDENDNRDEKLYMRKGDNYILENTWISGEKTPNDPFHTGQALGRADLLKRVVPGTYIMEELKPPEGYAKAYPVCVTVEETDVVQRTGTVDEKIKVEITKIDAPDDFRQKGIDYDGFKALGRTSARVVQRTAPKGTYTYLPVVGAELALFRAKKIYTSDYETFPDGWYFIKTEAHPAAWTIIDEKNTPVTFTASWTSTEAPFYLEGMPVGTYILEEVDAPPGYVRSEAWLEVKEMGEVQTFQINNDHTKLEIFKYQLEDGKKTALPNANAARLGLYPAVTDENGSPIIENGSPLYQDDMPIEIWQTDNCRQYTTLTDLSVCQEWGFWTRVKSMFGAGRERYSGFEHDYEAMYREYGSGFGELHWYYTDEPYSGTGELPILREGIARLAESREADQSGCVTQIWLLEDGRKIRITVSPNRNPMTDETFTFEYQYHYRRLSGNMVSYDTREGCHRIEYISWNSIPEGEGSGAAYVLAEIKVPEGYQPAKPKLIIIHETSAVQMYAMENQKNPEEPELPPEETKPEETTPPETPGTTVPPTGPGESEEPELPTKPESTHPQTDPETPDTPRPDIPEAGDEPPVTPEAAVPPAAVTLIGTITAKYDGGRQDGSGRQGWYRRCLPRTGDMFPFWFWMTLFFVSGLGTMIVRRKKDEEKTKTRGSSPGRCYQGKTGKNVPNGTLDSDNPDSDGDCEVP